MEGEVRVDEHGRSYDFDAHLHHPLRVLLCVPYSVSEHICNSVHCNDMLVVLLPCTMPCLLCIPCSCENLKCPYPLGMSKSYHNVPMMQSMPHIALKAAEVNIFSHSVNQLTKVGTIVQKVLSTSTTHL